jgi:2-polyprenyl-6-methoxyphenol hydroxylase-like FAD-dependent oxidoreductase
MVCACLLARAGLETLVLERNRDFQRELRGEILQPRFHKAMRDVGLLEHIARYPHEEVDRAHFYAQGRRIGGINLRRLDRRVGTTWWMTQPNLLKALWDYGRSSPDFGIWFDAPLKKLQGNTAWVEREGVVEEIRAKVIIGADGRFSTVRKLGKFALEYDQHDLDVVWFILPRPKDYEHIFSFFLTPHHNYLVLPKHPQLLQCGLILKPDEFKQLRRNSIDRLKEELASAHPVFESFAADLKNFSSFHPLKGSTALVSQWARDGLLLIGDAAHTCSPVGGIGVAVAVETACVAAEVVLRCFEENDFSQRGLGRVQALRESDIRTVHALQHRVGGRFVGASGFMRGMAYVGIRLLSRGGLLPVLARRLLTQRRPLPLSRTLAE